jgi:hypothetical protein
VQNPLRQPDSAQDVLLLMMAEIVDSCKTPALLNKVELTLELQ